MVTKTNTKEIWRNYETWPSLCSLQNHFMKRKKSLLGNPTLETVPGGVREKSKMM